MLLKDKLIETRNKIDINDAEIIFQHVLKIDKAKIYSDIKKEINKKDLSSIDLIVEERLKGKPLAYLIGKKGFWKNSFIVTPDVLVPRPETETLVDAILEEIFKAKLFLSLEQGLGRFLYPSLKKIKIVLSLQQIFLLKVSWWQNKMQLSFAVKT